MRLRRLWPALLAVPAVSFAGPLDFWRADPIPEPSVRDLAYGEILFDFFQEEHFDALTRLLAGLDRNELPAHARDADLLLGALYLSYGQHRVAGQIFDQVLAETVDPGTRDRVWYFLARVWHQRGYLAEAEQALLRIESALPVELEPDRIMLHAQILMELGRFDQALTILRAWEDPEAEWVGYSMYNVGVALVRLGRVQEGAAVLDEIGRLYPENTNLDALRDKANVALGYAWLQADAPGLATEPLQRVRLTGPYSNKALLGVGWANAELENFEAALAPWLELRGRNLLDSAVQESWLAVPYAFAALGADRQAADHYVEAIAAYSTEVDRLEATIESIRNGELVARLLADSEADGDADGSGWYWRLDEVPDSDASRYLYELLASHRFQEALKTYRDVHHLNRRFERWSESLEAFDDILDTRQRAYAARLPVIERSLGQVDIDRMVQRRLGLEARLAEIEAREDVVALGTADQQRQWAELTGLEPKLEALGDADPRAAEFRDKQRFLKGLLLWDLRRDYGARLWSAQRSLRELDRELKRAGHHRSDVSSAAADWPRDFAALSGRIEALSPRVDELRERTSATLVRQQAYLERIAIETLEEQSNRLNTYMVQARFSLAAVYDRATANVAFDSDDVVAEAVQ